MGNDENPYDEGTAEWNLMNIAMELSAQPASDDDVARAIDRLTVAIYRVGAELTARSEDLGRQIGYICEEIRQK